MSSGLTAVRERVARLSLRSRIAILAAAAVGLAVAATSVVARFMSSMASGLMPPPGWTALHAAAYQGLNDVIAYLVSKGAKIDRKDEFGQTALSISLSVLTKDIGARRLQIPRRYREDTAQLLLKLGAGTLDKTGVDVVLQRSGDLNLGKSATQGTDSK